MHQVSLGWSAEGQRVEAHRHAQAPTPRPNQPVALEPVADRAGRGPLLLRPMLLEPRQDLLRAPKRVLLAHLHQRVHQGVRHSLRMAVRQWAAIHQPGRTARFVTLDPLVSRLAAYPEAPAERRKTLVRLVDLHQKTHPSIHQTDLFPGHRRRLPPCPTKNRHLLPRLPV